MGGGQGPRASEEVEKEASPAPGLVRVLLHGSPALQMKAGGDCGQRDRGLWAGRAHPAHQAGPTAAALGRDCYPH